MIINKKTLLLWLCVFNFISAISQVSEIKESPGKWQLKSLGKNSERLGDIYAAIDYYNQYLEKDTSDFQIKLVIANMYVQIRDYKNAENLFLKIFLRDKNKNAESLYFSALMEINQGLYDSALVNLDKFKKILEKKKLLRYKYATIVENRIAGCLNAKKIINTPLDMNLVHLDSTINKAHIEFSPFPTDKNSFIYASLKADKILYFDPVDSSNSEPLRKLYRAKKINNKWESDGLMEGPFNSDEENTGNGSFSPDGKRFYFTKCSKNHKNKIICKIYQSKKEGIIWTDPELLNKEINTKDYSATQPTVGIDPKMGREVLYFVSNRPGSKGGTDIWFSVYNPKKNKFNYPKNLGSTINTVENEASPFYDNETHSLFFSSAGWPGLGGFDIFKSTGDLTTWTNPENMGTPVNSCTDDLYYTHFPNKEDGFFTSNRKGSVTLKHETCCDDIYYFKYNKFIHLATRGIVFGIEDSTVLTDTKTSFEILDDKKSKINYFDLDMKKYPLMNKAVVKLFLIDSKNNQEILIGVDSTDMKGEYTFPLEPKKDYKIIVKNYGNIDKIINLSTQNIIDSDTIKVNPVGINVMPKKTFKLHNIRYETDKAVLTEEAKAILDTTLVIYLKEHSDIIIELSAHTDNVGSDKYNQILSNKRAESVVNYLTKKGISKNRLVAKGFGESLPIADNNTIEGRDQNRRTEFKIVGSVRETKEKTEDIN